MTDEGYLSQYTTASIVFHNLSQSDYGIYYCYGLLSTGPFLAQTTNYIV